jgi:hypothetical protein
MRSDHPRVSQRSFFLLRRRRHLREDLPGRTEGSAGDPAVTELDVKLLNLAFKALEPKLCVCGCGAEVSKGKRFVHGHNTRIDPPSKADPDVCAFAGCNERSQAMRQDTHYCVRHYRFLQMRTGASSAGKVIPSMAELESLVPADMRCTACGTLMNWLKKDGADTCITLQHDRSGEIKLICFSCNVRHHSFPGDTFYDEPKDHRYCVGCEQSKPSSEFYRRSNEHWVARCKSCTSSERRVIYQENPLDRCHMCGALDKYASFPHTLQNGRAIALCDECCK